MILRIAIVIGVTVALAGCGSSDDSATQPTESTTPPTAETDALDQLPEVPAPTEAPPR